MKLGSLFSLVGWKIPSDMGAAAWEISAIVHDTRAVVPGCVFVCIRGTKVDGNAFAAEAVEKGAAVVVTEREVPSIENSGTIFFHVEDAREALARLCDAWYGHPASKMQLIAVTGTNGKTSVSTMLKAMFDAAMIPCGLIGTVRCICRDHVLNIRSADQTANMTTPDPEELYHILSVMAKEGCQVVIMEATSHALAQKKLEPLSFDTAIFTNLTPEHLDYHKTMEAYFAAKARLFPKAAMAVLNADDNAAEKLLPYCHGKVIKTSTAGRDADYTAEDIFMRGADGVTYTVRSRCTMMRVACSIPGVFTVSNTLQAIACAYEMGIPAMCIREALNTLPRIEGRMEKVRLGVPVDFSVFVDYAHTPDALENLLRTAHSFRRERQRIVLVFGCGGERDKIKRPQMGGIASRFCDMVYITSDNSRGEDPNAIIADILAGMDKEKPYRVIPDRATAIETAIREAQSGDIILLAGKGHERYEINGRGRFPFDERKIASEAAARMYPIGKKTDNNI